MVYHWAYQHMHTLVTTKKITKKKNKRESKWYTRKNQTQIKAIIEQLRNKKDMRNIKNT